MQIARHSLPVVMLVLVLAATTGCTEPAEKPAPEPKVAPPAIGRAGVLRAGVDLTYPPFGGIDKGREAGIDVDLALALASQLALELELAQVAPSEGATALANGDVDIVLAVPLSDEIVMSASLAGTYISDASAFFSREGTGVVIALDSLGGRRVAAQQGSAAFWLLEYQLGEEAVASYPTLREAFQALEAGEVDIVAGDYIVGAYIARDFEGVRFSGTLGPSTMLGVAVQQENLELEQAVRAALDNLATDGTLDRIIEAWVGAPLPSSDSTSDAPPSG